MDKPKKLERLVRSTLRLRYNEVAHALVERLKKPVKSHRYMIS